mgnify:FL=1
MRFAAREPSINKTHRTSCFHNPIAIIHKAIERLNISPFTAGHLIEILRITVNVCNKIPYSNIWLIDTIEKGINRGKQLFIS